MNVRDEHPSVEYLPRRGRGPVVLTWGTVTIVAIYALGLIGSLVLVTFPVGREFWKYLLR